MKTELLENQDNWYKGNLHMHTTCSDGRVSPEEAEEIYYQAGYDFIALTDHRKPGTEGHYKDMLLLSGVEWDTGDAQTAPVYHIIGVGMKEKTNLSYTEGAPSPQHIIDVINAAGGIAILAHPHWSVMNPDEMQELHGLAGAEIYNSVSGLPFNPRRADSSLYFDLWAGRGILVRAMAADDAHYYTGDQTRSFIMVNAPECTGDALITAIQKGNFYASQGPKIYSITIEDEYIHIKCSPDVKTVIFNSNMPWAAERVQEVTDGEAFYRYSEQDRYIRIELIDQEGRMAWSSPYSVNRF
ncbi:MAG: CehA/McbA family metallohydrolase [Butyrivibrio sp.]|jgi:hypothetical protein|nr:CehA/McbA family metallohydrolase [Butyrivibrio sp.]